MSIYLADWKDGGQEQLACDFELTNQLDDAEILLAYYCYEDYVGSAFVLFRKEGKLYEVNASHCSCFGLEGQWEPEETTKDALLHRLNNGGLGVDCYDDKNEFASELRKVLAELSE
jgi:hypothetical protein